MDSASEVFAASLFAEMVNARTSQPSGHSQHLPQRRSPILAPPRAVSTPLAESPESANPHESARQPHTATTPRTRLWLSTQ